MLTSQAVSASFRKQEPEAEIAIFLMGDAVVCAKTGQKTPDGDYNLERMLKPFTRHGEVLLCGTCMDARGMAPDEATPGARRSSMDELTERTLAAGKMLVF